MKHHVYRKWLWPFLMASALAGSAQTVRDITEIQGTLDLLRRADVNGKVLLDGSWFARADAGITADTFQLFPGWPVTENGDSERGGIPCHLDSDPDEEIVYCIGQKVHAWNVDGSCVTGWPQNVIYYPDGAPAFGDIDGDGEGEIVVSTRSSGTANSGALNAFEKDGTAVAGFPVYLSGGATKTPVLADLDNDDVLEIIVEERNYPNGYVGIYRGDGTAFPGWPQTIDYVPGSAVAVGDITGDDIPEIIAESYYSIYAFDVSGTVLSGFPFTPGNDRVFSYSSPVLADLDADGYREIIAGDHSLSSGNGAVHVLRNDGLPLSGWPKYTSYWIYGPPAVGDIDGDGSLDVAIGDQVLSGSPVSKVHVWDSQGNYLPGWPTSQIWAVNNQIILADVDGDGMTELIWDDNTGMGIYLGYNHDGTPAEGWPLHVQGSTFFMNPFVTDIDKDGILDISGGGIEIGGSTVCHIYLWRGFSSWDPAEAILPVLQYGPSHDGVYRDPEDNLKADFYADTTWICTGGQVQFTDISSGNISLWEWSFPGGTPSVSQLQHPQVTYSQAGVFDVTLIVHEGYASDTLTKTGYISVDPCTGTDCMHADAPAVYPNPSGNMLTLELPGAEGQSVVSLFDFSGRCVAGSIIDRDGSSIRHLWDVSGIPEGVYLLSIVSGDLQMHQKIMIRR
ncbi:MAG: VCBS repeat-containing protein [Bacteroidales bacterium]|nr:VCBS repeat-containing protein [Bacteroidales bacterium]